MRAVLAKTKEASVRLCQNQSNFAGQGRKSEESEWASLERWQETHPWRRIPEGLGRGENQKVAKKGCDSPCLQSYRVGGQSS